MSGENSITPPLEKESLKGIEEAPNKEAEVTPVEIRQKNLKPSLSQ